MRTEMLKNRRTTDDIPEGSAPYTNSVLGVTVMKKSWYENMSIEELDQCEYDFSPSPNLFLTSYRLSSPINTVDYLSGRCQ